MLCPHDVQWSCGWNHELDKMALMILMIAGLPIAALAALLFFLNEVLYAVLFSWWRRSIQRFRETAASPPSRRASVIILNWNGKELLGECLPSVVEAVQHDGGDHELIVVDNGSTDGSVSFLKERFPQVRVVALEKNLYFTGGNNAGAKAAKNDILVFLNNDMRVEKDFLGPLLEGFSGNDVFAVSSQIVLEDPERQCEETGKTRAKWRWGFIDFRHDMPTEGDFGNRYVPTFWLGGGSAAVDRRKFFEIGGFDTLMNPFYVEDTDLSYQAWKRGWKVVFCPESKVIHKHRASTGRFSQAYVERTIRRNQVLFIWKNITEFRMLLVHLLLLPLTLWRMSHHIGAAGTTRVVLASVVRLPQALYRRNRSRVHYLVNDREVFKVANSSFEYKRGFVPPRTIEAGDRLRILFVCPYLPSLLHGGGVRIFQMIRHLSEKHEVSLLSFSDNKEEHRYIPQLKEFCKEVRIIARRPYLSGMDILRSRPSELAVQFGDPELESVLCEMLGDEDYDIVQFEYIQMACWLPHPHREVAILTEMEVRHAALLRILKIERNYLKKAFLGLQWLRWLNAEISLCRDFDKVVAVTEEDAWALKRFDPRVEIEVIPTGVDIEYFSPMTVTEEPNSLIYTGNFRHLPNVDAAMYLANEILPIVAREIPDVKLYLVGAWPTPEVKALARRDRVVVTGWVEDIRSYLARGSVFTVPVRLGVGIRGKILEAWAMGGAVIASPLGCAGLHAQHGRELWMAEGTEAFAEGIVTLLRDPQLRKQMGRMGRRLVETKYSWDMAVSKQIRVYMEALRKQGR